MMTNRAPIIIAMALTVVAVLCLLQQLINLKRLRRNRQPALPMLALVYCIVGVELAFRYYSELGDLLARLGLMAFDVAVVVNALLVVAFLMLKAMLLPAVYFIWKKVGIAAATSGGFYEFDDDYSEWFLTRKWANVRKLYLLILICIGALNTAFISIMQINGPDSQFWLFCFPAAALLIVGEVFSYINGSTRSEFVTDVLGEDSESRRVGSFHRVREIYEEMFPGQILAAHTGCEFSGRNSASDYLSELSKGDRYDRMTASYFAMRGKDHKPDLDSVMTANRLLHSRSVVFLNPFYRDIGLYLVPSFSKALLSGKKCLVIAGRNSTFNDIVEWLKDILADYNTVKSLWRISELGAYEPSCDVGVISSRHMFDMNILKANRGFFSETDFTFIVEPSLIINIGQIGLNIIVDEIHKNTSKPVFCICDRSADGIVDTMSHLLKTELTDVIAMPVPRCIYSGMAWNVDGDYLRQQLFDKQTRYLGNGVELVAVAIKNQIPKATWYSETKSPVRDINWIAGQFHHTICRYMNIPSQQSNMYAKIEFESNIWKVPLSAESFILIEDEFCNMFNTLRAFFSRGIEQAFVNVLSENYILRDYMRCNAQLFLTDPGAIPSFVPDYAKTLRNTVIKLILQMTVRPVSEAEVVNELYLAGYKTDDAFGSLSRLVQKFSGVDDSIFSLSSTKADNYEHLTDAVCSFTISAVNFERHLKDSLRSAFYIIEDEENEASYIDAKLFGHVTQTILPGQFVTYDGKYYYAKIVSPESGVVLRRASDLYDSRKYYRQIRKYAIDEDSAEIIGIKKIMDVEVAYLNCSFKVITTGYLEMNDNNDLRTARMVDYASDPGVSGYTRQYRSKTIMRIHFPEANDKIRFTICMLMMEVFHSLFPHAWHYLAAVAARPGNISGMLNYLTYEIDGNTDNEYIYIIEDSDVDLGLLDAVGKNLIKIMEIIADFLDWHFEKMREPAEKDPAPVKVTTPEEAMRRKEFLHMADRIRKIFGGKEEDVRIEPIESIEKKPGRQTAEAAPPKDDTLDGKADFSIDYDEAEEEAAVTSKLHGGSAEASGYSYDSIAEDKSEKKPKGDAGTADGDGLPSTEESDRQRPTREYEEDKLQPDDDADLVHVDGTDIFEEGDDPYSIQLLERNVFEPAGILSIEKSRYQRECYLKFGFEDIDGRIRVEDVRNYLRARGFTNNALTKSRLRSVAPKTRFDLDAVNHCDFCGMPLTGISYERITDGRVRCRDCSNSAIVSLDEAREMFYKIRELMTVLFSIELNVPIGVKITDAQTIAQGAGSVFKPSTGVASRVLGYASKRGGAFFLSMENGSPRLAFIDTMVHELTHIWQYVNWSDSDIEKIFRNNSEINDIVYEGMAMWASVQYLYLLGETSYAELQELLAENREDVYGIGFCLYREKYPFVKDYSMIKFSPFTNMPPL